MYSISLFTDLSSTCKFSAFFLTCPTLSPCVGWKVFKLSEKSLFWFSSLSILLIFSSIYLLTLSSCCVFIFVLELMVDNIVSSRDLINDSCLSYCHETFLQIYFWGYLCFPDRVPGPGPWLWPPAAICIWRPRSSGWI